MSLKCPFCGNEYYHDMKICQICEDKSVNSGLVYNEVDGPQRWNLSEFLGIDTLAFGRRKHGRTHIKIASEPKFSDFKPNTDYNWNCDPRYRLRNYYSLKSELLQLRNIKNLSLTVPEKLKREISAQTTYE
jgi:hypothetical protein